MRSAPRKKPRLLRNNREFIPNFGERRRNDKTISTVLVRESTINQVVSRRFVNNKAAFPRLQTVSINPGVR